MLRLEYLHMKYFTLPFVALGMTEVTLDYRDTNKLINIFVGKMGTCKTFLLGHHQPFATLGNLDVRNKKDMVMAGKKGVKEMIYRDTIGNHIFEITHYYTPTKTGHTVKSYIKKNGEELNENGNDGSFRQIIKTEFDLEQNHLKLFRIGSNVVNLPDMTSVERKAFISSMLSDTEVYMMLYKKIGEENRMLNAQMSLIVNKLQNISKRSKEQLAADAETESSILEDVQKELADVTTEKYRLEGSIQALLNGMTKDEYIALYNTTEKRKKEADEKLADIEKQLDSIKGQDDPSAVNQEIAKCHAQIEVRSQQLMTLQGKIEEDDRQMHKLQDQLAVMGDESHIQTLRNTYASLMGILEDYERKLSHFSYTGSSGSIVSLISEVQNLNGLIAEISQYNPDAVKLLFRNSTGGLNKAKRELERAKRDKARVQQEMDNIVQISSYQPTHAMIRPFNCPTKDCPFYQYHPIIERKRKTAANVDKVFLEKRNQLNQLDAKIYLYEDYPTIAHKLGVIKDIWRTIEPKLSELGVLKEDYLGDILVNITHRDWIDLRRLDTIRELCGIREKYYELSERVASMRADLARYDNSDAASVQKSLQTITTRYHENCATVEQLENANREDEARLTSLNEVYLRISNREMLEKAKHDATEEFLALDVALDKVEESLVTIRGYEEDLDELTLKIRKLNQEIQTHTVEYNNIQRALTDIKITEEQYAEVLARQKIVRDILDGVSSKKGIPLIFVKIFLDDCLDDLNDLISDVFEDSIEIQKFDIKEDGSEFNIPYTRNGELIGDIIESSQGERAIISLALSFALIRQASFKYNIMLLDEVDGPLHKDARNKFINILFKQLQAINAEQVFIVSHNNTFDGFNVNVILTSDEVVDESPLTSVMRVAT